MPDNKKLPPLEELSALFSYDEMSGILTWKIRRGGKALAGSIAGTISKRDGYVYVMIKNKNYMAHRLIWKMKTGIDPIEEIDHRDLDKSANKWSNLRESSHSGNQANRGVRKDSLSRTKGVRQIGDKFEAYICPKGKMKSLGRFMTIKEASARYAQEAVNLFGEFARV